MSAMLDESLTYDQVAEKIIELGNKMLEEDDSADVWELASGMLAGAVEFWLFSREPCEDPMCGACAEISSAELRLAALLAEVRALSEDSDYYKSHTNIMTGTH